MPRIYRLRVVGLKYNKMKKRYDDKLFQFHNNEEAVSTLISLVNGGGKGALLQTISQIMLPGTSWGSKDERKFRHFFFNEKGQFKPYTFYVLIEWLLDTPDKQFLLTGVVLSAEQIMTKNAEEVVTKIKPKYKLFTSNYVEDFSSYSLLNLPLDLNNNFDNALNNLANNKVEIHGKASEFYKHVESFGLSKEEWEIMKRINKEEGGVKDFFKNSEDNHSLFHQKIIPTISQQLRRREDNGTTTELTEIFKSQASIAKNLPILMKRESSLRELINLIEPFKQSIQKGLEYILEEKKNEKKGFQYVLAFDHLINVQEEDLQKYNENFKNITNKLERIDWEKENLKYAKLYRQIEELDKKVKEEKLVLGDIENEHINIKTILSNAKLDLLLVQWSNLVKKIEHIVNEINAIRKSFENNEIETRLTTLRSDINNDWNILYPTLIEVIKKYLAFHQYNLEEKRRIDKEKENQIQLRANHQSRVNILNESINRFNVYSNDLTEEYGEKLIYQTDLLLQNFQRYYQLAHKAKEDAVKRYNRSKEDQKLVSENIGKIKAAIEEKKRQENEVEETLERQLEEEKAIGKELSILLQEEINEDLPNWLLTSQNKLINILQEVQNNLLSARELFWKKQLDASLSKNPFWIANHDLKTVKDLLETEAEIFYGTEFLMTLPLESRIEELENNPLLVHGLVLQKKEWEKLSKKNFSNLLLHSPVPIFIREEMVSKNTAAFSLLEEQSRSMILDEEYFDLWKKEVSEQLDNGKELVERYESILKQYTNLLNKLTLLLNKPSSNNINQNLQYIKLKILDLNKDKSVEEANLNKLEADEQAANSEINTLLEKLTKYESDLEKIRQYKNRKQVNQVEKEELVNLNNQLKIDDNNIVELGKEHEQIDKVISDWKQAFMDWKQERKTEINRIVQVVSGAIFPDDCKVENSSYEKPLLNDDIFNEILVKLTEYETLNKSQMEKNHQLELLNLNKTHHSDNKEKIEKQMIKISLKWASFPIPIEHESILESKIDLLGDEFDEINARLQKQNNIVNQLEGSRDSKNEMLSEIESDIVKKKRNTDPWDEIDLEEKEYSIEEEYKAAIFEEKETNGLIELTQRKINEFDKYKKVIQSNLVESYTDNLDINIIQLLQKDADKNVNDWTKQRRNLVSNKEKQHLQIDIAHSKLKQEINMANWDFDLKSQVEKTIEKLPLREYNYVLQIIDGMHSFAISSLSQLSKDKEKAEEAQNYWTTRASMKVISIIDYLKLMIKKMVIENENGFKFPLVKLKNENLPEKPEDIEFVLKQHFTKSIELITSKFDKIESGIPELDEEIGKLMSDQQIVFEALRHRYPTLMVYNLQTNNAFRYERPKDEYYSTWETINSGSEVETSGSGGQVLSARMVIMMMLLSLKSHSQKWTTLICDNPFGQAASEHVLDPIFAASELLRFQLIVVTPPELVKTEISRRFPVYYALELKEEKGIEKVIETVQYSFRTYHDNRNVMS